MWIGSRNVRWGLLGTEQRFRVLRREFVCDPASRFFGQPFLYMSPTVFNDSSQEPLLLLLVYMLLTGNEDLPNFLPPPNIDHVTTTIFVVHNEDYGDAGQRPNSQSTLPSPAGTRYSPRSNSTAPGSCRGETGRTAHLKVCYVFLEQISSVHSRAQDYL